MQEPGQKNDSIDPAAAAARNGSDILLQAFNLESHKKDWWEHLVEKVPDIGKYFTSVWLPPPTNSFTPEGYHPQNLYSINSAYGTEYVLKSLLHRMKMHNVRAMADIVINHRVGTTPGHNEKYNRYDGIPLAWDEHAVTCCSTDGKGNKSTGDNIPGFPNVDHSQLFVRKDIINWLRWLRTLGFQDFRFHFANGYSPEYVKEYIERAKPIFSVGEYKNLFKYKNTEEREEIHRTTTEWINGTGQLSAAFDYTTKAFLHKALLNGEFNHLCDANRNPTGLMGSSDHSSLAVTFLDNHETVSVTDQGWWPFPPQHVTKGYAYILTHPGTPCVFYDHFYGKDKEKIVKLIEIRKKHGIHSGSKIKIITAEYNLYAAYIEEKICMKMGTKDWDPSKWCPEVEWKLATHGPDDGDNYAVWYKAKQ